MSTIQRSYRILITDDDNRCREALRDIMEPQGYQTLEASCGEEAVDIVRGGRAVIQVRKSAAGVELRSHNRAAGPTGGGRPLGNGGGWKDNRRSAWRETADASPICISLTFKPTRRPILTLAAVAAGLALLAADLSAAPGLSHVQRLLSGLG